MTMLPRLAQISGLSEKVQNIMEIKEDSEAIDVLFKSLWEKFNGLRDPSFTQPIFDAETSNEMYAPIGNFKYIWNGQLYSLDHNNDPQFVAQALVWNLKIFNDFSPINPFSSFNAGRKIIKSHGMDNYNFSINEIFKNEAT